MRLFTATRLGALALSHRVVMAPLTRMRAEQPRNVPNDLTAEYYGQRASQGGLVIAEATHASPTGQGYPSTPGIHSQAQIEGWRKVTAAVHERGGLIVLQLWHVGRISHPSFQPGRARPVAPSAVAPAGYAFHADGGFAPYQAPRALEVSEIRQLVEDFRAGLVNAAQAGFDGVEIHGANGYLLQQFLEERTNLRTDAYGGTPHRRARFLLEIVDAAIGIWGRDRVGVRLSPFSTENDISTVEERNANDSVRAYTPVIKELAERDIAYLHLIEPRSDGALAGTPENADRQSAAIAFRPYWPGKLIAAGGFTRENAEEFVEHGHADAVAFGRHFIANPDLPRRLQRGKELNRYDRATFYQGDHVGYTDYPTLEEVEAGPDTRIVSGPVG